jgi:hypothetical protein
MVNPENSGGINTLVDRVGPFYDKIPTFGNFGITF